MCDTFKLIKGKPTIQNTLPNKVTELKGDSSPQKAKAKGTYDHQTSLMGNVKGTFLSNKEENVSRNKEICEEKTLPGKGKHTVKVVEQPLIKLE